MVYIYNGVLFNHKRERNKAICNNRDGLATMPAALKIARLPL